jgi:Peptidase M15
MILPSLSDHLTVAEFIGTSHRDFLPTQRKLWDETPALQDNGRRFAESVFEPVRALCGPLHVNSGYRCQGLNLEVGGVTNSYHMLALACDVLPLRVPLQDAMRLISDALKIGTLLDIDKVIIECGVWIHMQAAMPGKVPRRLALATDDTQHFQQFA